jgi:hypothetical protein
LDFYPTYHPTGGVQVLQKEWNLLSDDVKAILQIAESNLNALNAVHVGPKRPFGVSECALWAWLTGPRFVGQVARTVSLVEAPSNNGKTAAVAKEVMAIMPGNRTGLLIEKFLEAPFAGKHLKLISKGTKAAAAEASVTAAKAIAVADLEEAKLLAAQFEAMGSGALTMALAQEAKPGDPFRKCWLAHERLRVPEARSINRAEILTARTDTAAKVAEVAAAEAAPRKLPPPWKLPPPRKLPPPWNLPPPQGPLRKAPPMRLARKRLWLPNCRKSLAAARAAWLGALRKPLGGPCFVWGTERN